MRLPKPEKEGSSDGMTFPKLLVCLNSMHSLAKIQKPVFGANVTASTIYEYYGQFVKFGGYDKDDWDQYLLNHTIKDWDSYTLECIYFSFLYRFKSPTKLLSF